MSENGIKHPSCGHSAGCNGILGEKSILPAWHRCLHRTTSELSCLVQGETFNTLGFENLIFEKPIARKKHEK
jgi:hypothetical protein